MPSAFGGSAPHMQSIHHVSEYTRRTSSKPLVLWVAETIQHDLVF
jgi:hypothetical protein